MADDLNLNDLHSLLRRIKTMGEFSDLTISCGEDEYHVHRAIICPQSDVLAAMCRGPLIEAQTQKISLPDDDTWAIGVMLDYLYGSSKSEIWNDSSTEPYPTRIVKVFAVADKYHVQPLKHLAKGEFKWGIQRGFEDNGAFYLKTLLQHFWESNKFPCLHSLVEEVVAESIDMILEERPELVEDAMKLGMLSVNFIRKIMELGSDK